MKILFLNIYYENFLRSHYKENKIAHLEYMEQWDSIQGMMFGDSDIYSRAIAKRGWLTHDLITNCKPLQKQWAKENDYTGSDPIWFEQIRKYKPDVVFSHGLWLINDTSYPIIKDYCQLIVGKVGSKLSTFATDKYDVIFTAVVPYVDKFREVGVKAYYLPLGFDPLVLERIGKKERDIPISFVGQLIADHARRKELLTILSKHFEVQQWVAELWGLQMFDVMARSYMTINCNIDTVRPYVGNMRLYEATGCGALTLTDDGANLGELFEDDEILKYKNPEEAVALVRYYMENKEEGKAIAAKGQKRTLADHAYDQRMEFVAGILEKML